MNNIRSLHIRRSTHFLSFVLHAALCRPCRHIPPPPVHRRAPRTAATASLTKSNFLSHQCMTPKTKPFPLPRTHVRAVLTVRRARVEDARPAAKCMAEVFRSLENPPKPFAALLTYAAYMDMLAQLSRRLKNSNSKPPSHNHNNYKQQQHKHQQPQQQPNSLESAPAQSQFRVPPKQDAGSHSEGANVPSIDLVQPRATSPIDMSLGKTTASRPSESAFVDPVVSSTTRMPAPSSSRHVLLLAEDKEQAPGDVIGCVEIGVVNVPRLLTKGILDEIEQWGAPLDHDGAIASPLPVETTPTSKPSSPNSLEMRPKHDTDGCLEHKNISFHQVTNSRYDDGDDDDDDDIAARVIRKGLISAPYLGNLAVAPNFRRRGIGSRLVREAETIAVSWGYDRICLHVDADQPGAKALYASLGYECVVQEPLWHKQVGRVRRMFLTKMLDPNGIQHPTPTTVNEWDEAHVASAGRKLNPIEYIKLCIAELRAESSR